MPDIFAVRASTRTRASEHRRPFDERGPAPALRPGTCPHRQVHRAPSLARERSAVRLAEDEARARLAAADHGILCTVHEERGVDGVPVAYVTDDLGLVGMPVDLVKPKS